MARNKAFMYYNDIIMTTTRIDALVNVLEAAYSPDAAAPAKLESMQWILQDINDKLIYIKDVSKDLYDCIAGK